MSRPIIHRENSHTRRIAQTPWHAFAHGAALFYHRGLVPDATIVIVTRNRKQLARTCVESSLAQTGDLEILVLDDASTDGTSEYLRELFPQIRVVRSEEREGLVVKRTRAAEMANSPILISIDDDAYFLDNDVCRDTVAMFSDPRIGAAAIPHFNKAPELPDVQVIPTAPKDGRVYVAARFIGTAYAVRRDVFLQLGGFQGYLYHWGEETEFTQRLVNAGYFVRVGTAVRIRHCYGGEGKYTRQVQRYIYRNRILITWLNAPLRYLFPLLAVQTGFALKQLLLGRERPRTVVEGLVMGCASMFRGWRLRKPVSVRAFKTWVTLRDKQLAPLDEVADAFR